MTRFGTKRAALLGATVIALAAADFGAAASAAPAVRGGTTAATAAAASAVAVAPAATDRSVAQVVGGAYHTCALLNDGTVHCWGYNADGELGIGSTDWRGDAPEELPTLAVPLGTGRTATAVTAGLYHTCALLDDGTVHCWGYNADGELGIGTTDNRGDAPGELPTPAVPLGTGRTAVAISAGGLHTCAVLDDGTVRCWGFNNNGQLGIGTTDARGDEPGELPSPSVPLGPGRTAVAIGAMVTGACVLLDDGTVHCWGGNSQGQLGVGDTSNRGDAPGELPTPAVPFGTGRTAVTLATGGYHACVVLDNATTHCWGYNGYGQLGIGSTDNRGDAPGELPPPAVALGTAAPVAITSSEAHNCAVLDDGTVHCWGYNGDGELGIGTTDNRGDAPGEMPTPAVAVGGMATSIGPGALHTCAVLADGTAHCWGYNAGGELGIGTTDNRGDAPGELPTPAAPTQPTTLNNRIVAGYYHSCAIVDDGTVHCWGANIAGYLGIGTTDSRGDAPGELPTPAVPLGQSAVALAAGAVHTCALLDDGTVHCWGNNGFGQLGLGDTSSRGDEPGEMPTPAVPLGRPAVAIASSYEHTCAILDDGTVHCWGTNDSGQLGLGDTNNRGDQPGELPTAAVPLGRPAVAISTGFNHSCAILDDGSVHCWGWNGSGQLGIGTTDIRGDAPGELPTPAVPLGAGRKAVALSSSEGHNCAILDDGTVHCWGGNGTGALGIGTTDNRGDAPGELPTPAVNLGTGRTALSITNERGGSCAQLDDGTVHCWGWGMDGALGVGSTDNRGDALGEMPTPAVALGSARAVAVSGGEWHACAVLEDATVHCWGYDFYGQLGVGATDDRGDAPGELPTAAVPTGGTLTSPAIAVDDVSVKEADTRVKSLTFHITRTNVVGPSSVAFSTADLSASERGDDYEPVSGRVTIPAGVNRVNVSVPVDPDLTDEPDETLTVALSSATGGHLGDAYGVGTIVDNDPAPTLSIGVGNVVEGTGPNTTLKTRVTLDRPSGQVVTVKYTTANGTATAPADYVKKSGTLTFQPGDRIATVSITVVADSAVESTEYFYIALSLATNATIHDSVAAMYIIDDDGARHGSPGRT
jgi:alpha-tubulin suppressor-like RCC1 family protein